MKKKKNIISSAPSDNAEGAAPAIDRRRILWSVLFIAIAAATIWAVVSHSGVFSLGSFRSYVAGTSKGWLAAAVLCMLCFVVFEGGAVAAICRGFGYPTKPGQGFIYSTSDIYFSAITPSASGGQPACAYFMLRDGIPASAATIVLLINLTMYTLSILVISLFTAVFHAGVFMSFSLLSRVLILVGAAFQVLLAVFFVMLLTNGRLLHRICRGVLHFLCRLRLLRNEEEKKRRIDGYISEYESCSDRIKHCKRYMVSALVLNLLQRMSIISVSFFVILASGGSFSEAAEIWAVQSYVIIGSNAVPIPGAMGVSDYILLDGSAGMMPYENAVNFELLSRSLSFYFCIILCGATVLAKYLIQKRRKI